MNVEKPALMEVAAWLFKQRGLRSCSFAEIAWESGVTVKNLQAQYPTKTELIVALVKYTVEKNSSFLEVNPALSPTAVTELSSFFAYMEKMLLDLPPAILFELKKFYPQAWSKLQEFRIAKLVPCLQKNLQRGIAEGYYRLDFDQRLYARIYFSMLGYVVSDTLLTPSEITKTIEQLHGIFRNGILNAKGIRV